MKCVPDDERKLVRDRVPNVDLVENGTRSRILLLPNSIRAFGKKGDCPLIGLLKRPAK